MYSIVLFRVAIYPLQSSVGIFARKFTMKLKNSGLEVLRFYNTIGHLGYTTSFLKVKLHLVHRIIKYTGLNVLNVLRIVEALRRNFVIYLCFKLLFILKLFFQNRKVNDELLRNVPHKMRHKNQTNVLL